jgi:hypothetical protein
MNASLVVQRLASAYGCSYSNCFASPVFTMAAHLACFSSVYDLSLDLFALFILSLDLFVLFILFISVVTH